tara:strand:+ start:6126 stop:6524 length:399 start_codon:yes stop_codon:yes gene_type:complete
MTVRETYDIPEFVNVLARRDEAAAFFKWQSPLDEDQPNIEIDLDGGCRVLNFGDWGQISPNYMAVGEVEFFVRVVDGIVYEHESSEPLNPQPVVSVGWDVLIGSSVIATVPDFLQAVCLLYGYHKGSDQDLP